MEEDGKGLGIGGHDDELAAATVQGLGGLVGALLELLEVASLLDKLEDGDGELLTGERVSAGVHAVLAFLAHLVGVRKLKKLANS